MPKIVALNTKAKKDNSEHLNYGTTCLTVALNTKAMALKAYEER